MDCVIDPGAGEAVDAALVEYKPTRRQARIMIREDADGEHDVYDYGAGQAIGAGNIVIHSK